MIYLKSAVRTRLTISFLETVHNPFGDCVEGREET